MNDREKLREQILGVDTVFVMDNTGTEEFLPPNFYIDRLVDCILDWHSKQEVDELKSLLTIELPWPEDIFPRVPDDDWPKIHAFATKELGYPLDRISGELMRRGWKCLKRDIQEQISELEELATLRKENGERV